MSFLFDYVFYRVAHFYYKSDGRLAVRAVISVSTIQVLPISAVILFIQRLFYSRAEVAPYSRFIAVFFTAIFIVAMILNYVKYKNKYFSLRERWYSEKKSQKLIRGIAIVAAIILSVLSVMFIGIIR